MTFYNENDPQAAAWLRALQEAGELPKGVVDERSIIDLRGADCGPTSHFFSGLGGWPYALRLAGWPDDTPVWTGSCPCQPFSQAGKRRGALDERHLWPVFRQLIAECRPPIVFGEQVASKDGRVWLAGVRADLEAMGYAVGAADLCAAGVGAPHIRQRLYWVAVSEVQQHNGSGNAGPGWGEFANGGSGLEKPSSLRLQGWCNGREGLAAEPIGLLPGGSSLNADRLEHPQGGGLGIGGDAPRPGEGGYPIGSSWAGFDLILFRDGSARRVESGASPLVARLSPELGRGYTDG